MGPRASQHIQKRKNLLPLQELQPQFIQFKPRHNTNYAGLQTEKLAHFHTLISKETHHIIPYTTLYIVTQVNNILESHVHG